MDQTTFTERNMFFKDHMVMYMLTFICAVVFSIAFYGCGDDDSDERGIDTSLIESDDDGNLDDENDDDTDSPDDDGNDDTDSDDDDDDFDDDLVDDDGAWLDGCEIEVSQYFYTNQSNPRVAMDPGGGFVAVWESEFQDGDSTGIIARRFAADGYPMKNEFQVNDYTIFHQMAPDVAAGGSGEFIIAWENHPQNTGNGEISAKLYDNNGDTVVGEFVVNALEGSLQTEPKTAMASNSGFVVIWKVLTEESFPARRLMGQYFNADGSPRGDGFYVNEIFGGDQHDHDIAINENGDFVITWTEAGSNSMRIYDSSGAPVSDVIDIGTHYEDLHVAMFESGYIIVVFHDTSSLSKVVFSLFDQAGVPVATNREVASENIEFEGALVAAGAGDNFTVAGLGSNSDLGQEGLLAIHFDAYTETPDLPVQLNAVAGSRRGSLSFDMNANGNFVAVWVFPDQWEYQQHIGGRLFQNDGQPVCPD